MDSRTSYGKMGIGDQEIIDRYLALLPDPPTVVNLGCGFLWEVLYNLGHKLGLLHQQGCTLILADAAPYVHGFKSCVIPGNVQLVTKRVNAFYASRTLGCGKTDAILAFGLFADLSHLPRTRAGGIKYPDRASSFASVLRECRKVLRTQGILIVSNSSKRQPMGEFLSLACEHGFDIERQQESPAIYGAEGPGDLRYLLVLRKVAARSGSAE